jgi:hypothetical protein
MRHWLNIAAPPPIYINPYDETAGAIPTIEHPVKLSAVTTPKLMLPLSVVFTKPIFVMLIVPEIAPLLKLE